MTDTPNPEPTPTVEDMLRAIFRLLVVIAIALITATALLIIVAFGKSSPPETPCPKPPRTSSASGFPRPAALSNAGRLKH